MSERKNQLLPRGHEEFRTKGYWDDFFRKRGDRAFEWYGDYAKLTKLCTKSIDNKDKVLVIGCGNSDYSSDLYDAGYHSITNIDFSEMVIQNMTIRNALREEMRWLVMDMTAMSFPDASFDVVFDKGGLDALMAVDSVEVRSKADAMFADIARVTRPGGRYLCVTLAEPFIIYHLLHYFLAAGWEVSIDVVVECGGRDVPFIPFFVSMSKPVRAAVDRTENEVYPIKLFFDSFGERIRRCSSVAPNDALEQIRRVQSYQQRQHALAALSVGRFEQLDLWAGPSAGVEASISESIPKYTLTIVDRTLQAERSCAVFFVPSGREASYQFTAQDCLTDIAEQAQTKRLLVVRCNRPHVFPDMKGMQAELSPVCRSLAPVGAEDEAIPFMGVLTESEWTIVTTDVGEKTGELVVEEMESSEEGAVSGTVYRRLVFLRNQQFIQTEVRLVPLSASKKKKKKKKGVEGSGSAGDADTEAEVVTMDVSNSKRLQFDHRYLDAHHCSMLVSVSLLAGAKAPAGLVVGLGGGALPMALKRYLPASRLVVCELDPGLLRIARKYFGFTTDASVEVLACDGMKYILDASCGSPAAATAAECPPPPPNTQFDYIVLDADSADVSLGLSAPPAAFVTIESVNAMHNILSTNGLLVVNVVARDKNELKKFVDTIRATFGPTGGDVYVIKPSDDTVNLTIVAVKSICGITEKAASLFSSGDSYAKKKGKTAGAASAKSSGEADLKAVLQNSVQQMLLETNARCSVSLDSDPLELRQQVELLRPTA